MSERNEAKYETLKYLEDGVLATSREIAEYRGVTHGCQSTLMKRYMHQGLLNRCSGEGKTKYYTMSTRGYERLEYLEELFDKIYFQFGSKTLKRCRIKNEKSSWDFLKNIKRCRIVEVDGKYIVVQPEPDE